MNALHQAKIGYGQDSNPVRSTRNIEYDVFAKTTQALKFSSMNRVDNYPAFADALYRNRRLWSTLAIDIADPQNGLNEELRGKIFYLAEFVESQTKRILRDHSSCESLVDVNIAIMRGLGQSGAGV